MVKHSQVIKHVFGFGITHVIFARWTNLIVVNPFIPAAATNRALAMTEIAPAFDHIFATSLFAAFRTAISFPFIAPVVRTAAYFTMACISFKHVSLLSIPVPPPLSFPQ